MLSHGLKYIDPIDKSINGRSKAATILHQFAFLFANWLIWPVQDDHSLANRGRIY